MKRNISLLGLFSRALVGEAFQRREFRDNHLGVKKGTGSVRSGRSLFVFRDQVGVTVMSRAGE